MDRLNRALDETKRVVDDLALKAQRPHLGGPGGSGPRSGAALQHGGAAELLGIRPSTLADRMKTLEIRRPAADREHRGHG